MAAVSQKIYDVVVGAAGHKTTLSDAKDVLRDNSTMYVKQETFSEGGIVTFPQENIEIFAEPGAVIDDGLTFQAPGVHLHLGKGCDVQGKLLFEEEYATLLCNGGCSLEEVEFQNHFYHFDGGGWDTILSDRLYLNGGDDGHVRNFSIDTKTGATGNHAIDLPDGYKVIIERVLVRDSDGSGLYTGTVGPVSSLLMIGCVMLQTDDHNVLNRAAIPRYLFNRLMGAGQAGSGNGLLGNSLVIYAPVYGNLIKDPQAYGIRMPTGADDWAVVNNRVDPGASGGISDVPGVSTVLHNSEVAIP